MITREEAMLKLLALEPERQDRIVQITGWGEGATLEVLEALRKQGRVDYTGHHSCAGYHRMWFVHGTGEGRLLQVQAEREARKQRSRSGAAGRAKANSRRKASTLKALPWPSSYSQSPR